MQPSNFPNGKKMAGKPAIFFALMFVPTGFLLIIGVASNTKPDRRVIQLSHSNKGGLE